MKISYFDSHRRLAFIYLLSLICFGGIYFGVLNAFFAYNYPLSIIDFTATIISSILLYLLIKDKLKRQIEYVIRVYLFVFYAAVLLTLSFIDDAYITLYLWIFLVPPLSYLLLGREWGIVYTSAFVLIELAIFHHNFRESSSLDIVAILSDVGFCLVVVWILTHIYEKAHTQGQQKLIKLASEDFLTGLLNRSALKQVYLNGLELSVKNNRALSIVVFDIDWFKKINDTYGHDAGDKALLSVAKSIAANSRPEDSIFRLGGEEFCMCLPNTSVKEASLIAEEIRARVENSCFKFEDKDICITVSAGIASADKLEQELNETFKVADKFLYQAKHSGRNQIVSPLS